MVAGDQFALTAGLLCEPARARMMWSLLDGRAYTAGELAISADISPTAASNHLSKLLAASLIKLEIQGRHRYYSFANADVAYVVEAIANLSSTGKPPAKRNEQGSPVRFCRTCYDHLAGFVGVAVTEALEQKGVLHKYRGAYRVDETGWNWFAKLDIDKEEVSSSRRLLARQCLDWSERRPHLAGALGAALLEQMMHRNWMRKVAHSRELVITSKGKDQLVKFLGLEI